MTLGWIRCPFIFSSSYWYEMHSCFTTDLKDQIAHGFESRYFQVELSCSSLFQQHTSWDSAHETHVNINPGRIKPTPHFFVWLPAFLQPLMKSTISPNTLTNGEWEQGCNANRHSWPPVIPANILETVKGAKLEEGFHQDFSLVYFPCQDSSASLGLLCVSRPTSPIPSAKL